MSLAARYVTLTFERPDGTTGSVEAKVLSFKEYTDIAGKSARDIVDAVVGLDNVYVDDLWRVVTAYTDFLDASIETPER